MNIQTFLRLTIAKRIQQYMNENNLNNKEFIAETDRDEFNQANKTFLKEVPLSKLLNGDSISMKSLESLTNFFDLEFSEFIFGTDEDKLYLIRIILYNILGNGFLFNQDELEELQAQLKFRKSKEATLNYWLISIPQTTQTIAVAKSLLCSLLKYGRFSKEYCKRPITEYLA